MRPRAQAVLAAVFCIAAIVWAIMRGRASGLDGPLLLRLAILYIVVFSAAFVLRWAIRRWRWARLAAQEDRYMAAPHCLKCGYPVQPRSDGDDDACICPECGWPINPYVARHARELLEQRATGAPPGPSPSAPFGRKGEFLRFLRRLP